MLRQAVVAAYNLPEEAWNDVFESEWSGKRLPRVNVTHAMPDFNERDVSEQEVQTHLAKDARMILLTRDPRDAIVSLYFHIAYRSHRFHGTLDQMVRDGVFGIRKFVRYYQAWFEHREIPGDLLIISYEDLHRDAVQVMRRAVDFAGLPPLTDEQIAGIVAFGSFENMRSIETSRAIPQGWLHKHDDSDDPRRLKTRSGRVGEYVNHMSAGTQTYIESCCSGLPDFSSPPLAPNHSFFCRPDLSG